MGSRPHVVALLDLEGDGDLDIAVTNRFGDSMSLIINESLGPTSVDANWNGVPDEWHVPDFLRGDTNADGALDISDAIAVLLALFAGGPEPPCEDAMDADDGGRLTIGDAIGLLGYLFHSGLPPAPPFRACGADPTADALGCQEYSPCAR